MEQGIEHKPDLHEILVKVHVSMEKALRAGNAPFGEVPLLIDLWALTEDQRVLLATWGAWERRCENRYPWPVMYGTRREWCSAEDAKKGVAAWRRIDAAGPKASVEDVLLALEARRSREPQNAEWEKIAQERRAQEEQEQKKPVSRWKRFWS